MQNLAVKLATYSSFSHNVILIRHLVKSLSPLEPWFSEISTVSYLSFSKMLSTFVSRRCLDGMLGTSNH